VEFTEKKLLYQFETQGVFEFAHVDPWGGHSGPEKKD
jgi:hypothetical protein